MPTRILQSCVVEPNGKERKTRSWYYTFITVLLVDDALKLRSAEFRHGEEKIFQIVLKRRHGQQTNFPLKFVTQPIVELRACSMGNSFFSMIRSHFSNNENSDTIHLVLRILNHFHWLFLIKERKKNVVDNYSGYTFTASRESYGSPLTSIHFHDLTHWDSYRLDTQIF